MTPLLERRFLVVSGKGGVGRTTVAAALALAAADAGKRVLVAQASAAERLGRLFGRQGPVGTGVIAVAPGVDAVNMTPQSALHEYGGGGSGVTAWRDDGSVSDGNDKPWRGNDRGVAVAVVSGQWPSSSGARS